MTTLIKLLVCLCLAANAAVSLRLPGLFACQACAAVAVSTGAPCRECCRGAAEQRDGGAIAGVDLCDCCLDVPEAPAQGRGDEAGLRNDGGERKAFGVTPMWQSRWAAASAGSLASPLACWGVGPPRSLAARAMRLVI